jgi:hypothetical protein
MHLCKRSVNESQRMILIANSNSQDTVNKIHKHVGDELTFVVISAITSHAVYRSDLQLAMRPDTSNICVEIITTDQL